MEKNTYENPVVKALGTYISEGLKKYRGQIQGMKLNTVNPLEYIRLQSMDATLEDITAYVESAVKEFIGLAADPETTIVTPGVVEVSKSGANKKAASKK